MYICMCTISDPISKRGILQWDTPLGDLMSRHRCPPQTSINLALYGLTNLLTSKILQWTPGSQGFLRLTGLMKLSGLTGLMGRKSVLPQNYTLPLFVASTKSVTTIVIWTINIGQNFKEVSTGFTLILPQFGRLLCNLELNFFPLYTITHNVSAWCKNKTSWFGRRESQYENKHMAAELKI